MPSESSSEHKSKASDRGPVSVMVVTVSDTRTTETDVSGNYLRRQLEAAGHRVHSQRIIRDEPAELEAALDEAATSDVQVVIFNGGTGFPGAIRLSTFWSANWKKPCLDSGKSFAC